MSDALAIYLRNHEAAAQAGCDLVRRVAANQRSRPYGAELKPLVADIEEDARRLRALMKRAAVRVDMLLGVALRAGERLARFKPNGHLLTRAPLSDLIEVEGLLDAVRAKWAGWRALAAMGPASLDERQVDSAEIDELAVRAEQQIEILLRLHAEVSARVLAGVQDRDRVENS